MATIEVPTFWLLQPHDGQCLGVEVDRRKYKRVTCATHREHCGSERGIGNLAITIPQSRVKDFTWSWMSDILISQRVLDVFAKHRISGYETMPTEVFCPTSAKGKPPPLFDVVVTGWGSLASAEAAVTSVEYCPDCKSRKYTIAEPSRLIDPNAWDGSDLFIIWPLPRFRFASDRLATLLRQEHVSGVKLIPASEIHVEKGDRLNPGHLSSHMPSQRARDLSQRFGIE